MRADVAEKPKAYLACKFENKDLVRAAAAKLETAGVETISTWHHSRRKTDAEAIPRERRDEARKAVREIASCDALVVLDARSETGGLHFETALAFAQGRLVILVGPPTNIFHELPEIHQVPSLDAAIYLINGWFARKQGDC